MAINVKESRTIKYDHVFLEGLPLQTVFHSHLKHLLTVCGMHYSTVMTFFCQLVQAFKLQN